MLDHTIINADIEYIGDICKSVYSFDQSLGKSARAEQQIHSRVLNQARRDPINSFFFPLHYNSIQDKCPGERTLV